MEQVLTELNVNQASHQSRCVVDVVLPGGVCVIVLDKVDAVGVCLVIHSLQLLENGVTLHTLVIICN